MSCGAVVLAAGASRRFGTPKQLAAFNGRPLVAHAAATARDAGCEPVVVVTGADADRVRAALAAAPGITVIVNDAWARGQGTSVAAGIRALRDAQGAVRAAQGEIRAALMLTCDQPLIPAGHLRRLADLVGTGAVEIAATRHADGRGGVPACFDAACFEELMRLDGPAGARSIIRAGRWTTRCIAAPGAGAGLDVDTPADLARLAGSEDEGEGEGDDDAGRHFAV